MQMLCTIQNRQNMLVFEHLSFTLAPSKQLGRLKHVLDLPAVEVHLRELLELPRGDGVVLDARGEEVLPDHAAAVDGEIGVVEGDVDAGLEGGIEGLNAIVSS
jgi:hypothetical protein